MREYVSGFASPRIVRTEEIVAHLREMLPNETRHMNPDDIKAELYELEGVLQYHASVDGWTLAAERQLPERLKPRF